MTLVVGRQATDGVIRVVADMRLTDRENIRRGYPHAVLKNIILRPGALVAYAGNSDLAIHTIRQLKDAPMEDLLAGLLQSSEGAGGGDNGVDYLVADVGRGLHRIRHTGAEAPSSATWIGEHAAFEAYQELFLSMPPPQVLSVEGVSPPEPFLETPDTEGFLRMSGALMQLHWNESVDTVGEALVSAFSRNGFHYEPQGYLAAVHDQEIGPEWTTLNWGTAAQGGFGYNLLHPTEPGISLIGLYFPHAGLGLLYHPLAYDGPAIYRRVTHDEFRAAVAEDHGVAIDGPRLA